jgi:cation-transporting P-type ATPase I
MVGLGFGTASLALTLGRAPVSVARQGALRGASVVKGLLAAPGVAWSVVGDAFGSGRQVWLASGRAQIEVRGSGALHAAIVEAAVDAVAGVAWSRVDLATSRVVVRFDPARVSSDDLVAAVDDVEASLPNVPTRPPPDARFPGDPRPVARETVALVVDIAGLAASVVTRVTPLSRLPGSTAAAAVVLVDYQPRLRRILERRVGAAGTDWALTISTAAVHGLTGGVPSLLVDTAQRGQSVLAVRARRDAFTAAEAGLCGPHRAPSTKLERRRRPVPLPPGPVERLSDRAAVGSLLGAATLTTLTGRLDAAGQALLIGAPKAARTGREAFASTMLAGISREGILVCDPAMLRRMDRVDTLLVDSAVLMSERQVILDASPTGEVEGWTREHVWSAAQRLLSEVVDLRPPLERRHHRLALVMAAEQPNGPITQAHLTDDGVPVGELVMGRELDQFSDAVFSAAQRAGLRVVVSADVSTGDLASRADVVLPTHKGAPPLSAQVAQLQADGAVVAVVSTSASVLAGADIGIAVVTASDAVPWDSDVLCRDLRDVTVLVAAMGEARGVSERSARLSVGASSLGALIALVGSGRRGGAALPVNAAAASALVTGTLTARRVLTAPAPVPMLHTQWHALEPDEVVDRLTATPVPAPPAVALLAWRSLPMLANAVANPLGGLSRLASGVRAELADPLTPVLATGAAASAIIGSPTDAILVGGVLAANALISGAQRLRAESALNVLLMDQRLTARRVGTVSDLSQALANTAISQPLVPAEGLRVGDVILLNAGDVVPADARVVAESGLEVDEASLTGESISVPKQVGATPGAEMADRACLVFEGTTVLAGTGHAIVVATGSATEAGRAADLAADARGPVGMQARLEELTRRGLPVTLLGGAAVTGLSMLRGRPLRTAIASGVSVAVAAVPEGLPLVATVAQLSAARRLSRRGVLVRSARSVEALGRVDTICFDKTGTLTEGRLHVVRAAALSGDWLIGAPESAPILRAAAQACPRPGEGPVLHATDRAVLDAARTALGDTGAEWEQLNELPFHSDRGFSASLGRSEAGVRLVLKGAPEVLLPRCTHVRDADGKRRFTKSARRQAERRVEALAADGLRVLAVARRTFPHGGDAGPGTGADASELTENLTLLGFIGLADVARAEAAPTIAAVHAAGLSTVMITGDHPITAQAIARGLGIPAVRVVTGPELIGLDDAARSELVRHASVFARVSPEQKLRIIAALQKAGRVVAMVGDGANDAAAIRLADVGIGMAAHGSSSARSAADLVFTDPDLSLLLDALVEGRAMWRRVRDAVAILLGGNAGEVAFTLAGTALAGRAPLGTRQFLLVNMLTDLLPAMAIALAASPEGPPARHALLSEEPPSLGAPLLRDIAVRGTTTGLGALTAWQIGRVSGTRARADTIALGALVGTQLGQTLVVGGRNPLVLATGLGSAAVLAAIIQTPGVSQFFGCRPLGPVGWAVVLGTSAGATVASVATLRLRRVLLPDEAAESALGSRIARIAGGAPAPREAGPEQHAVRPAAQRQDSDRHTLDHIAESRLHHASTHVGMVIGQPRRDDDAATTSRRNHG